MSVWIVCNGNICLGWLALELSRQDHNHDVQDRQECIDEITFTIKSSEISINTLVNQILKRFVEWDMLELKVGMVAVAKPVVTGFLVNQ